jgi:hypothetical protein
VSLADGTGVQDHPNRVVPVHPARRDNALVAGAEETEGCTQMTDTYAGRGWEEAPAALLLRRATDEVDTAYAHIAGAQLSPRARTEMMQQAAALIAGLERLLNLLRREGNPVTRPASTPLEQAELALGVREEVVSSTPGARARV